MFELSIRISNQHLNSIKTYLRAQDPDIKSSHRCEALARGLGFQTYASMLAGLRGGRTVAVTARSDAFSAYLRERDFNTSGAHFLRAVANVALSSVLEQHSELTSDGMGVYARHSWGHEPLETFEARRAKSRADMRGEQAAERFLLALAFVQRIPKTKSIRSGSGYRRMKHIAEKMPATFPDGEKLGPQYLPAGFLLAAAIHDGFNWKKSRGLDDNIGPEVRFNMLKSAVTDLAAEIRYDDGYVQDRLRSRQRRAILKGYPRGTEIY